MITEQGTGLGPATVKEIAGDRVLLQRGEKEVWAHLALSYPYQPEPGDVVLTIGEEETYIIGVLLGRGKTVLDVPGDLRLRAQGKIEVEAGDAIELRGPTVTVTADKFETIARAAFEKFVNCYRWIKEAIHTQAGRSRTVVDGHHTVHAERIVQTAEKDVKIDGEKIHLG